MILHYSQFPFATPWLRRCKDSDSTMPSNLLLTHSYDIHRLSRTASPRNHITLLPSLPPIQGNRCPSQLSLVHAYYALPSHQTLRRRHWR
ncbi:hypothetical protein EDB89DRAFT_2234252 [Lactarius sanguifluus]|nr:hypothetical protein EDB89DRAFT_2234252 [Lactarius sanguifluus]